MNKDKIIEAEVEEVKEIVPSLQSVTLSAKQLEAQVRRDESFRKVLADYISRNLKEGIDTYTIEVRGNKSKPSLSKSGSEKFCSLMKIRPVFRIDEDTRKMLGDKEGIIAYICELVDAKGRIVGEGRGSVKVDLSDTDFNINKSIKIAEKRAQVDAVLRTGGLSDYFTQDLEDMPKNYDTKTKKYYGGEGDKPSDKQINYLKTLLTKNNITVDEDKLNSWDKKEASRIIDALMKDAEAIREEIESKPAELTGNNKEFSDSLDDCTPDDWKKKAN